MAERSIFSRERRYFRRSFKPLEASIAGIAADATPAVSSLQRACVAHLPLCSTCPEARHFTGCSVGLGEDHVQLHFVERIGMRACSRETNLHRNVRLCRG